MYKQTHVYIDHPYENQNRKNAALEITLNPRKNILKVKGKRKKVVDIFFDE